MISHGLLCSIDFPYLECMPCTLTIYCIANYIVYTMDNIPNDYNYAIDQDI